MLEIGEYKREQKKRNESRESHRCNKSWERKGAHFTVKNETKIKVKIVKYDSELILN